MFSRRERQHHSFHLHKFRDKREWALTFDLPQSSRDHPSHNRASATSSIEQFPSNTRDLFHFRYTPTTTCSHPLRCQSFLLELLFSSVLITSFLILLYFLFSRPSSARKFHHNNLNLQSRNAFDIRDRTRKLCRLPSHLPPALPRSH